MIISMRLFLAQYISLSRYVLRHIALWAMLIASYMGVITATALPAHAEQLVVEASQKLEWDQNKKLYIAQGDAFAQRGTQRIDAEIIRAFYAESENDGQDITRLEAEGGVLLVDTEQELTGQTLIYDVVKSHYDVSGPDARVSSPDGVATASEKIIYDQANGTIFLKGTAEMRLKDGREMAGDTLDITLDEAQAMDKLIARGNVVLTQADGRQSRSEFADYNAATGKALLTGNVQIMAEGNILNGQRAEIDFNNGISRLLPDSAGGRVTGTLNLKSSSGN